MKIVINKKNILLVLLLIFCTAIYYFGFFDRINLINNTILVKSNLSREELEQFELFFGREGGDTIQYKLSEKKSFFNTPDWYGKDHLILKKDTFEMHIRFKNYKFSSWHKVSGVIFIIEKEKEKEININWYLSTKWYRNIGAREIPRPAELQIRRDGRAEQIRVADDEERKKQRMILLKEKNKRFN
ncbi:MAG: hypothetical protein LBR81_07530 [Prevotellaceae bacterium]|jgi:hypothetical protein|nr:hypothetical protein [Prevotellaceae bacterium]